jgi:hypothetical protein
MTQDKVLYAFAANEMKKQNNSYTEAIDSAVLPGASAAQGDGNLDMRKVDGKVLRPSPHKEAPEQYTEPVHRNHCP